jgi:hypothetical protein
VQRLHSTRQFLGVLIDLASWYNPARSRPSAGGIKELDVERTEFMKHCYRVISDITTIIREMWRSANHSPDDFRKHNKERNERCR